MSKTITVVCNALSGWLKEPTLEVRKILVEVLSYFVVGYENTDTFKRGKWDGKSTMFDWRTDTFPVGFLSTVNAALTGMGYEVRNIRKPLPAPLGRLPEALGGFRHSDRYDYQWQLVDQLEKRGMMIARLATGAGKTFGAALAIARINRPTLILTKRQPLLYQFWERLQTFGYEPGIVGDNRFSIKPDLTVAMVQTLSKKLLQEDQESVMVADYLKTVEFIIGEEAHEISDRSYWHVVRKCSNAHYKLALTATPFMKDKSESNMKLLGAFGPSGLDVSEQTLINRGINATPKILFAGYEKPARLRYTSNYQKAVTEGINYAPERNAVILEMAKKAIERKLPVMVLINRQDHGKELTRIFDNAGIKSYFIFGETESKIRSYRLKQLETGKIQVLIGSTILDVGVDVPDIGLLILAGGGKAEVGYRQRIGRGLRAKKDKANVCFVLDFEDGWNCHLHDHYRERHRIIMRTPGFAENVVFGDFPWGVI